eukprot:618125-Prorocentrum_minimum.AAC.2
MFERQGGLVRSSRVNSQFDSVRVEPGGPAFLGRRRSSVLNEPIRCRKRGYNITSFYGSSCANNAGSAGIFSRWTNRNQ